MPGYRSSSQERMPFLRTVKNGYCANGSALEEEVGKLFTVREQIRQIETKKRKIYPVKR